MCVLNGIRVMSRSQQPLHLCTLWLTHAGKGWLKVRKRAAQKAGQGREVAGRVRVAWLKGKGVGAASPRFLAFENI